jgi:hypothetical protein
MVAVITLPPPSKSYYNGMKTVKIVVEKHADGYVAYPLGLKGVIVGQGDTDQAALSDCQSAIRFHIETFGPQIIIST